tara:strand:- start:4790 stop:5791 length:1002 start_codon:yes stop_codon:yes gene_type:complete
MQYSPYLTAAGFDLEFANFFDDSYLDSLYSGYRRKFSTLGYFMRRIAHMRRARTADLILVEKEALPWVPWSIERLLMPRDVPVVSDYDDAIFHSYDLHRSRFVRQVLGSKIAGVMARSDIVFAGNSYLADNARKSGAKNVKLIPTVVDMSSYHYAPSGALDGRLRVGWIGTPETWSRYGIPMLNVFKRVVSMHRAVFRAVGAGQPAHKMPNFEFLPWSESSEIQLIQGMDVGIMPLSDDPWSRGKCGYKLIQYMACGIPVVASPVGVNSAIVEHGVNGFLASTKAEWADALDALLSDADLRHRMGVAGRKKAEQEFSLQIYGPKVASMLFDLA